MAELNDDQLADLTAAINEQINAAFEYETQHEDAGNNYAHMPAEAWSSTDDTELMRQLSELEIDTKGLDADELSSLALDNFKMLSGSIYTPSDLIVLASFPVYEIETQLDYSSLDVPSIGEINRGHIEQVSRSIDAHVGSSDDSSAWLYHGGNYTVWYAVISPVAMQRAINDRVEG